MGEKKRIWIGKRKIKRTVPKVQKPAGGEQDRSRRKPTLSSVQGNHARKIRVEAAVSQGRSKGFSTQKGSQEVG